MSSPDLDERVLCHEGQEPETGTRRNAATETVSHDTAVRVATVSVLSSMCSRPYPGSQSWKSCIQLMASSKMCIVLELFIIQNDQNAIIWNTCSYRSFSLFQ
jgi:di/tricarboxylate transporter